MKRSFIIEGGSKQPSTPALMLATLKALKDLGGSGRIQEIDGRVIEIEEVKEEEQAIMMLNGNYAKINYYLAWARTYLKRGDAIENPSRGVWTLTEKGRKIDDNESVNEIYRQVNKEEQERQREKQALKRKKESAPTISETESDEDRATNVDEDWQEELLNILRSMDPFAFERLSQRVLREAGFTKVEVTSRTRDGGFDGIGILQVNLVSFSVSFECKRWQDSIRVAEIRKFRGALQGRADKGLFITTSDFTSDAEKEAVRVGAIAIDLIDGKTLCELLKEHQIGVKTEMVEKVSIDKETFTEKI